VETLDETELTSWVVENFPIAVEHISRDILPMRKVVVAVDDSLRERRNLSERLHMLIHSRFFPQSTPTVFFQQILYLYFSEHLGSFQKVYAWNQQKKKSSAMEVEKSNKSDVDGENGKEEDEEEEEGDDEDEDEDDEDQLSDEEAAKLEAQLRKFKKTCDLLIALEWAGLCEQVFSELLFSCIETQISDAVDTGFDSPHLANVISWVEGSICSFLQYLYPNTTASSLHHGVGKNPYMQWKTRLEFFAYERFGELLIDKLFDVIVEFPESRPAVRDLEMCLRMTDQHSHLIVSLKRAFLKRLLQPGANTTDIITHYISTIKSLAILDPIGVALEAVSEPVRLYLRGRPDTVRCILLCPEVQDELESDASGVVEEGQDVDLEEHTSDPMAWDPAPRGDGGVAVGSSRRGTDIIGMLVNIYGTKDVFVDEYQNLLSDRLLKRSQYDTDSDVASVELLKIRFGASKFHGCQVMLNDITNSKYINNIIRNLMDTQVVEAAPISAAIVSYEFWPSLADDEFNLPKPVQAAMESYSAIFEDQKKPRYLKWKPTLGTVKMDIELEDRTLKDVETTPINATIIHHFSEQDVWAVEELASVMDISVERLRSCASFWTVMRVLKEVRNPETSSIELHLMERLSGDDIEAASSISAISSFTVSSVKKSSSALLDRPSLSSIIEGLRRYESHIMALLGDFKWMPRNKLFDRLQQINSKDDLFTYSNDDIGEFMNVLISEKKVVLNSGIYSLP